jgi:hypothetical protein
MTNPTVTAIVATVVAAVVPVPMQTEVTLAAIIASVVTAAVGAVPPTMVAFAALRQSRVNAAAAAATDHKLTVTAAQVKDTAQKTDAIADKTTEIKVLADGHLSEVTSQLRVANERISGLEKMIASLAKGTREDRRDA